MLACPWCGDDRKVLRDETSFPASCPRCNRGTKLDWAYCPWCYGPGFEDVSERALHRSPLRGPLPQFQVRSQGPHAVHALLPVVPHEGAAGMENRRQQRHVPQVRLGRAARFLDALPVVRGRTYIADPFWRRSAIAAGSSCHAAIPAKMAGLYCVLCLCKESRTWQHPELVDDPAYRDLRENDLRHFKSTSPAGSRSIFRAPTCAASICGTSTSTS